MRLLQGILLPALLAAITALPNSVSAKKDEPSITRTEFDAEIANVFYFDDSETVLMLEGENGIVWRTEDAGEKWSKVDDIPKDKEPYVILKNPYSNDVAVALGKHKTHWITYDQGESWTEFKTDDHPSRATIPITFHAGDPKKILYSASEECYGFICIGETFYTDDGFKNLHSLRKDRKLCIWAVATDLIAEEGDVEENRIICVVEGKYGTHRPSEYRMVYSDNFFKDETETKIDGKTMTGFASVAAVKKWLVAASKPEGTTELALYTSMDSETWHKAEFGDHHVEEDAYTLLESTNYSIQVDVQSSKWDSVGVLFSSNSEGRFFTQNVEHTNRNQMGNVDFEKMSNVQGVIIVNVVDNWKEVEESFARKHLKTQLSFDDGRTFHGLKYKDKDLHLHSVTNMHNSGRIFSSPAPGLIMGVGNTGKELEKYSDGNLYVSDDGGLKWDLALEEAHKYEFGNQGAVLVAVYDEGETKEVRYSLTHGKDEWKKIKLEKEFRAVELTTTPDSTSLRFILIGAEGSGRKQKWVSYTINFADMHERECGEKDFETWHARVDKDDNALCVMGRKQSYKRRKADAECFVKEDFNEPVPNWEVCDCSDEDYECDAGFHRDDGEKDCVPLGTLTPPKGECEGDDDTYMGSSGWRKIPGNQCKGDNKKEDKVERKCSDTKKPPASGKITSEVTHFPGSKFYEYYYLERCETCKGDDETVVMRMDDRKAYITHDHGKNWEAVIDGKEVVAIYPHQYVTDGVFFITPSKKVHYSWDRGKTIKDFEAPLPPNSANLQILQFHPESKHKDWIIWTGQKDDDTVAYVSQKGGLTWEPLLSAVRKCQFMFSDEGHDVDEHLVYCEQFANEDTDGPLQLVSSDNWFVDKKVVFEDVVSFATMSEFIVIASRTENRENLKLDASIDGKTFADAKFPPKFTVEHQQAYTVLDSSTHSIFLHVTVNGREDQEYGTIIKSNSNGTSYVLSVNEVNRDSYGYVDFEKMSGLEGVALVNIVANVNQVNKGELKKKKTLITHNDGADWDYLPPPSKDSEGHSYDCSGDDCGLHLHGYTERVDPRATFSSASAVGLMMGVGNVGEYLGQASEGSTFLTRDGGITWKEVMKGAYMWEYGDQGSIIVIVKKSVATNVVRYTLDEGDNWKEYQFSEKDWTIDLISTVPSDTSMNFLLWGRDSKGNGKLGTVNLDFSGLLERQCELDDDHPTDGDYILWSPRHPKQDTDCLFGHIAKYHRKKQGELCFNGRKALDKEHGEREICECTRRDWECDYNYERQSDGSCGLVEGLQAMNPMDVCKDKDVIEYHEVTGFRKIPISTCEGGVDLQPETLPCPGHEDEWEEKHRASGFVIFLAVVLPIAAAAGIGYYVWKHWDGKFGRIRLGDAGSYGSFSADSPLVAWPVAAVSGLIAVLAALPLLVGSLWRSASGLFGGRGYGSRTYTSRSSFARGRGDYAIVDPDEGELLGDDSDEDV